MRNELEAHRISVVDDTPSKCFSKTSAAASHPRTSLPAPDVVQPPGGVAIQSKGASVALWAMVGEHTELELRP